MDSNRFPPVAGNCAGNVKSLLKVLVAQVASDTVLGRGRSRDVTAGQL